MIVCDLCGEAKDCLQKEIDGKEYDICSECWEPWAQKLRGKGKPKNRVTVFLPPASAKEREDEGPEPLPGEPPKIFGSFQEEPCSSFVPNLIIGMVEPRTCRQSNSLEVTLLSETAPGYVHS